MEIKIIISPDEVIELMKKSKSAGTEMDKATETKKSSTVASSETQEMVEIANKLLEISSQLITISNKLTNQSNQ